MTIGNYIKEKLSIWSVELSDDLIALELSKVGLKSSDTITAEINTDNFFYSVIPDIISMPNNVSEGGYSISWDKPSLLKYYSMVSKRLGKPNVLSDNTITDITSKW